VQPTGERSIAGSPSNRIRVIQRRGYGLTDEEHLRLKLIRPDFKGIWMHNRHHKMDDEQLDVAGALTLTEARRVEVRSAAGAREERHDFHND